ncbi:uncharacterized protein LOC128673727 isoform X1 [Plodia interpunctella]|uniref:uncharacterized protein LOC128673727 isoform X1 n=1 Tax=Plodia interpunctella TaxID=58824 RepID=UPI002368ECA7|nr:uncharacterized protein LOC128673727 isoform X1 [Plodia interpunctella]
MNGNSDSRKSRKLIKPKLSTSPPVHPEASSSRFTNDDDNKPAKKEVLCPLLAKDSEWVDIIQTPVPSVRANSSPNVSDEEEVLQLVECEEGSQIRPLAAMFPDLLDKDPRTLQGMLNKTMSTTEVTRTLVDLGQKANFKFMKKTDRLIPPDKKWLDSLTEYSSSIMSDYFSGSISDYDVGLMDTDDEDLNYLVQTYEVTTPSNPASITDISNKNSVTQLLSDMLQNICGTDTNKN